MADLTRSDIVPEISGSTERHNSIAQLDSIAPRDSINKLAVGGTQQDTVPETATDTDTGVDAGAGTSDITVVVCVYDIARLREIDLCLASLRRQTLAPAEVVVVIDGCAPLTAELRARYDDITLVSLAKNQGLSAARNAGLARVRTPWVAFLDDDAYAEPDWLAQLATARVETGAVGVGGWVEPLFVEGRPRWFPGELLWTVGCSHTGLPTTRTVVRNVFGGCALMQTNALTAHGGYDESVGRKGDDARGGEEADLCLRIRETIPEAQFVLEPSAVIHHHVPGARSRLGYVLKRCHADGKAKAGMAHRLGTDSLSSETAFVRDVVPRVLGLVFKGCLAAAVVLLLGMSVAAAGFATGLLTARLRPRITPATRSATSGNGRLTDLTSSQPAEPPGRRAAGPVSSQLADLVGSRPAERLGSRPKAEARSAS